MAEGKERTFLYDFLGALILIFLYIGIISIPWYGPMEYKWVYDAGMRLVVIILFFLLLFIDKRIYKPNIGFNPYLWPILLLGFSNLFVYLVFPSERLDGGNIGNLYQSLIVTILTVICEEIAFRYALIPALKLKFDKPMAILLSASIFAVCHLFGLFGGASVGAVFAQVGYTFFLGLLCGFFFVLDDFILSIALHFLFNFLETDVYLALGGTTWGLPFYLVNIGFGLVFGGYALFWYLRKIGFRPNKKEPQ